MTQTLTRTDIQPVQLNPIARRLLEDLQRAGPTSEANLPARWPLIRMHMPVLLDRLAAAGLVRRTPSPESGGAVVLTELGEAALRGG
jgi:DNA-binding MarR family transcriptional regulator